MKSRLRLAALSFLLVAPTVAAAQQGVREPGPAEGLESYDVPEPEVIEPEEVSDSPSLRGLPAVFYLPETSVGFGGVAVLSFWEDDDWSPIRLRSTVRLSAIYTVRRQAVVRAQLRFRRQGWPFELNASYDVRSYPDRYYGVGAETGKQYLVYTERSISVSHWLRLRLVPELFLLVGVTNTWTSVSSLRRGNVAPEEARESLRRPPGAATVGFDRLLFGLEWDARDHPFAARRGAYVAARVEPTFGYDTGTTAWTRALFDVRGYVSPAGEHVLAARAYVETNRGDLPFTSMAALGGPERIRGMYAGRYRDRGVASLEVEYRTPFVWRLPGAAFAGAGTTFGRGDPLPQSGVWNAGLGLRLRIDERMRTHARVDVSHGRTGFGLVAALGEAF